MSRRAATVAGAVALCFALATRAQESAPAEPRAAGPALRAALAALASDRALGIARLAEVERAFPIIGDHAAHRALLALAASGDSAALAERAAAFRVAHASSPLVGRVAALEGEAAAALGQPERAREAFTVARREAASKEDQARYALAIASALEQSGAVAEARAAYLAVWRDHAATSSAKPAFQELTRSTDDATGGAPRIRAADQAKRCRVLAAAYWNDDALRACDAALTGQELDAGERRGLAALRAELLFRDRRYPEAERAFAALPSSRENRFWRARALARSGRVDEAKAAFEKLGEVRDDWGARALFLAGTLYEDDDPARASERYRQSLAQATRAELRTEARWRLAWRAYLGKRWPEAARDLAALARDTSDPVEALRARYWEARALTQAGDAAGEQKLAALAERWGFTYYGQQAATRANGAEPAAGPAPPPLAEEERGAPLASDALLRPRILLEAGLRTEAGEEALALAGRARLRADRLALASLLQDAGEFHAAQRLILDAYALALSAGPEQGDPDVWWAAYPQAFAPEVQRAAERAGIAPELLFAVMREESGFRPEVLSVVGARGLVQIMPDTGRALAARLGAASFSADELLVPARNLELGAAYLAELLARFEGRVSAAVASYNAGPEAVARWLAQNGALEDDEWIEAIPYDQTRSYAKRVLRSFTVYQALYGS